MPHLQGTRGRQQKPIQPRSSMRPWKSKGGKGRLVCSCVSQCLRDALCGPQNPIACHPTRSPPNGSQGLPPTHPTVVAPDCKRSWLPGAPPPGGGATDIQAQLLTIFLVEQILNLFPQRVCNIYSGEPSVIGFCKEKKPNPILNRILAVRVSGEVQGLNSF